MLEVTDEMVKKAFNAWWDITDDMGDDEGKAQTGMRAALEAVAPMLIAQGMRMAADEASDWSGIKRILARAQELDPK